MATEGLNPRKALAGLNLLKGMSQRAALIAAGYSPATAKTPKHKGLDAKACIDAARMLDPSCDPGKLVERARRALGRKLDRLMSDDAAFDKTSLAVFARNAEVVERWYGDRAANDAGSSASHVVDALAWVSTIVAQLQAARTATSSGESPEPAPIETGDIPSNVR
jgi:hypothetical protein